MVSWLLCPAGFQAVPGWAAHAQAASSVLWSVIVILTLLPGNVPVAGIYAGADGVGKACVSSAKLRPEFE